MTYSTIGMDRCGAGRFSWANLYCSCMYILIWFWTYKWFILISFPVVHVRWLVSHIVQFEFLYFDILWKSDTVVLILYWFYFLFFTFFYISFFIYMMIITFILYTYIWLESVYQQRMFKLQTRIRYTKTKMCMSNIYIECT
jgi:hypothetical protein